MIANSKIRLGSSICIGQETNFYFALGHGGQYIIVVPEFDLVVVFTSRMYDNSLRAMHYFKEFILKGIDMN